jgi:hypothetical protein
MKSTNLLLPADRKQRCYGRRPDRTAPGDAAAVPDCSSHYNNRLQEERGSDSASRQLRSRRSCPVPPLKRRLNNERISDMAYSRNSKPAQKSFLRRLVGSMCFASLSASQKQFPGPLLLIQRRRKAPWYKQLP